MKILRANDHAGPQLYDVWQGRDEIGDDQMVFLLPWLEDTSTNIGATLIGDS